MPNQTTNCHLKAKNQTLNLKPLKLAYSIIIILIKKIQRKILGLFTKVKDKIVSLQNMENKADSKLRQSPIETLNRLRLKKIAILGTSKTLKLQKIKLLLDCKCWVLQIYLQLENIIFKIYPKQESAKTKIRITMMVRHLILLTQFKNYQNRILVMKARKKERWKKLLPSLERPQIQLNKQ